VIPQNSVAGRMSGSFNARVSTPTTRATGAGTAEWTMGGTYDPSDETVAIAIHSSGVDARGTTTALERASQGVTPESPFSTKLYWGSRTPVHYYWEPRTPMADDVATIIDVMKPPTPPVISSNREVDFLMVNGLPQTGRDDLHRVVLDLKDPNSQRVTQTSQDGAGLGTRNTEWMFTLVPRFSIERDDRGIDGHNSFISTDFIRLRVAIPGVTVAMSGWANLASWEAKASGPFTAVATPDQMQHSTIFGFQPNQGSRQISGSTIRNRPMQYTVSASLAGAVQYVILTQDEVDLLRQEYVDHNEGVVPARGDCIARRIDNSFNAGNYNVMIDGGMQAALTEVTTEFRKVERKGSVSVVAGFRSPQRNKAIGDIRPNNKHALGRALDLVPDPAGVDSLRALYLACVKVGYHSLCEAVPGKPVAEGNPGAKHVHIDW